MTDKKFKKGDLVLALQNGGSEGNPIVIGDMGMLLQEEFGGEAFHVFWVERNVKTSAPITALGELLKKG